MQILVDDQAAMMVQSFADSGVSIDFDRLLKLMAENSEEIEDFIQEIETGEPRFMFPVTEFEHEKIDYRRNEQIQYFPKQFLKGAVTILVTLTIFW